MICGMSRFIVLLLIALLPLRGWTVERMAVAEGAQAVAAVHHGPLAGPQDMPADCAMHMQAALSDQAAFATPAHEAPADDAHKGCQACQLCMPLATPAGPCPLSLAQAHQAIPRAGVVAFASAEPARYAKPPIS